MKKNSESSNNSFTTEQRESILNYLEVNCVGEVCIPRPQIFTAVQSTFGGMEEDRFSFVLSAELKAGQFVGFTTRRGRTGGVHREGVFSAKDAARKASGSQKEASVEVAGSLVSVAKPAVLRKYITEVLGATEAPDGNVKIGEKVYNCDIDALNKYLAFTSPAVDSTVVTSAT